MPRVKRGVTARARHKKILALAKGFRLRRNNVFHVAKQAVMRAGQSRTVKKAGWKRNGIVLVTAVTRSTCSAVCGLLVSTLQPVPTV